MNRISFNWGLLKGRAEGVWLPRRLINTWVAKIVVKGRSRLPFSNEGRPHFSAGRLSLLLFIFSLLFILNGCQFTRHGVVRNGYRPSSKATSNFKPKRKSDSAWQYQGDENDIPVKVLVYKGNDLDEKVNNLFFDGDQVVYGGRRYPLENDQTTIVVGGDNPIILKGNAFHGEMIVARKNYVYVVNVLPLEEYLVGVVRKEISYSWPEEAIKAQAVAARSFAYRKYLENYSRPYHLRSDTSDQVFAGSLGVHENIVKGVEATRGRILVYNDYPILTFFHASCGGMTEKAMDVWPTSEDLPYFQNIRCNYCTTHPRYSWEYESDVASVIGKLSAKVGKPVSSFYVERLSGSGRVAEVSLTTRDGKESLTGNDFRIAVGPRELFSTKFKISRKGDKYFFTGNGFGHGVGLCQWGAKTMAERGFSDDRILNFYYKKIRFSTVQAVEKKLFEEKKVANR